MHQTIVRKSVIALFIVLGVSGCAPEGAGQARESFVTSAGTSSSTTVVDLEAWCATQTPDRCIEGMVYLDWNPGRETCVFTSPDESRRFWDLCDEAEADVVPVTTIPTEESQAQQQASELNFEDEVASRLPGLDERAFGLVTSTHPDGVVTVGLVLADPLALAEVKQLADAAGAVLMAAWRTDYVCHPGLEDWPVETASRFAHFDGVERAARLQQEMENSTTPVTGGSIARDLFAVTEQEAIALREPGVLLEAVQAEVPVSVIESLRDDPRVDRVRLADFPTEWIDLSDQAIPVCEDE